MVRLSASASRMRDSGGLKKILMSTYSAGAACCSIKEELLRNQKYLTGIRIDTGKEEKNANRRYVTNFIDFSRLFFSNKDGIVAGKAQIKRAVLPFVGRDRTWADRFRNLHPANPLEPVCQYAGNGCDRRDRNLRALVPVLSEYTAFCLKPEKSGTCDAGVSVKSGK